MQLGRWQGPGSTRKPQGEVVVGWLALCVCLLALQMEKLRSLSEALPWQQEQWPPHREPFGDPPGLPSGHAHIGKAGESRLGEGAHGAGHAAGPRRLRSPTPVA